MEEIIVRSLKDVTNISFDHPWAVVQIANVGEDWPPVGENNCMGKLKLTFKDTDDRELGMSVSQAGEILDFVYDIQDRIKTLVVHCVMGQSRSPGVAAALSLLWFGDDKRWFTDTRYTPNRLVYRIILKTAESRPVYQDCFERLIKNRTA